MSAWAGRHEWTDLVNVYGALDGELLPGGCDSCNAFQKVTAAAAGTWSVLTHHERTCDLVDPVSGLLPPPPPHHLCYADDLLAGMEGPPEGVTVEPCPPWCLAARLAQLDAETLQAVMAGEWWGLQALGGEGWTIPPLDRRPSDS